MAGPNGHGVIRGGRLLDAAGRKAEPADILIEGERIAEVGPPGLAAPEGAALIEATGRMIMPGLVNAHTHGHGALAKGRGDRTSLELLLNSGPWISGARSHEDRYRSTLLNAAEMIRRGCTATYDLTFEIPTPTVEGIQAVAQAYSDSGLRALIAPMMADTTLYDAIPGLRAALPHALGVAVDKLRPQGFQAILEVCRRLLADWPHDPARIGFALAPTIPIFCSHDFLIGCQRLADEFGARVHTHLAESKVQAVAGLECIGHSLTAYLDALGLVTERFTAAHGVWLDEEDAKRLADRGATVASNPGSNLRLGSGLAPLRMLLDRGVTLGLGSDGSSSSDNQNMFEAMRLASFVPRVQSHDVNRWLGCEEVFEMATLGGAKTLGLEDQIGRIAPGYLADLAFLDLDDLAYVPLNDPVNQLVHSDDGSAVRSVMIGGQLVYDEGRFTTIDLEKLIAEVREAQLRLDAATQEQRVLAEKLEPLVASYCTCFSGKPHHIRRMCIDSHPAS